jgi:hypothetical protein
LSFPQHKNKHQWSVNDFQTFTCENQRVALSLYFKVNLLVGIIAQTPQDRLVASFE